MATFEKIAFTEVGSGGAADINLATIPGTYTDLCLKLSLRGASTAYTFQNAFVKINSSTTNQSRRSLLGVGSGTPSSVADTPLYIESIPYGLATASTFGNADVYITNYAGSTNKSISIDGVGENNATTANAELVAALYSSTSAITSIVIAMNVGNIAQYSTATLYGIKKA